MSNFKSSACTNIIDLWNPSSNGLHGSIETLDSQNIRNDPKGLRTANDKTMRLIY